MKFILEVKITIPSMVTFSQIHRLRFIVCFGLSLAGYATKNSVLELFWFLDNDTGLCPALT